MYCPKCGAATVGDAKFCRSCGADVSLVPMALTGQLPARGAAKREDDPSALLSKAITSFMTGFAFLVVAPMVFVFAPAGSFWWFYMFIPAFVMMGNAVADFVRYRAAKARFAGPPLRSYEPAGERELPPAQGFTNSLPPASVTEHTTRQLRDRERQEEPR